MRKENNNNIIYSTILLPELPSSAILKSTTERNQRNERCLRLVDSVRMLNVNNTDYVDYVLWYSPKWRKTVPRGEELQINDRIFILGDLIWNTNWLCEPK